MKENEMGCPCSRLGGDEKCIQNFDRKNLREETTWKM
jgi:hypothetical protein